MRLQPRTRRERLTGIAQLLLVAVLALPVLGFAVLVIAAQAYRILTFD